MRLGVDAARQAADDTTVGFGQSFSQITRRLLTVLRDEPGPYDSDVIFRHTFDIPPDIEDQRRGIYLAQQRRVTRIVEDDDVGAYLVRFLQFDIYFIADVESGYCAGDLRAYTINFLQPSFRSAHYSVGSL